MTVVYTHEVATGSRLFGNFHRLLLRWRGGIYTLVLPELIIYIFLYYSINVPYRILISHRDANDSGKIYFHNFVKYSRHAASMIPLQFVLGFYVSQVVTRWWSQYMTTPWPDTLAVVVASSIRGHDDRGRLMRRTILRYMNASMVMVLSMMSPQVAIRFPTLDDMVNGGYFVPHERIILENLNEKNPGPKFFVPMVWAGAVAAKARKEGRIADDVALFHVLKEICKFKTLIQTLLCYDWVNIPLVYTQVATLCTYIYFFSCLMAKQFINDPTEVDIYVPVFLFLEFIFMLGWLKVAETMVNPFGMDVDDFEVNWLVDRNIVLSYMIVDQMYDEFPEMVKDAFWDPVIPDDLMYTTEALKFKSLGMGMGSAFRRDELDHRSRKEAITPKVSRKFSLFQTTTRKSGEKDEEADAGPKKMVSDDFIALLLEKGDAPDYKDSCVDITKVNK